MTNEVTNADLLGVLTKISGDIGGLQASTALQLKALENHGTRITALEGANERQKGAVRVWGLIATAAATAVGAIAPLAVKLFKH